MAAIHVAPAVAHHPAFRQVRFQIPRGAEQHAGFGFAAIAMRLPLAGMIANFHALNGQLRHEPGMDFFHGGLFQRAAANVGLIGGDDEQKAGGFQFRAGFGDAGKDFKIRQGARRIGFAIAFDGAIDDAIAIEKDNLDGLRVRRHGRE